MNTLSTTLNAPFARPFDQIQCQMLYLVEAVAETDDGTQDVARKLVRHSGGVAQIPRWDARSYNGNIARAVEGGEASAKYDFGNPLSLNSFPPAQLRAARAPPASLGARQYRIILSADTASKVRQMLSQMAALYYQTVLAKTADAVSAAAGTAANQSAGEVCGVAEEWKAMRWGSRILLHDRVGGGVRGLEVLVDGLHSGLECGDVHDP